MKGKDLTMTTKLKLSSRRNVKKNNPPSNVKEKPSRFQVTHRDVLTKNERHKLLLSTESVEEMLLIRIGLNSGLRIAEIIDLQPRDFIYSENQVRVRNGKGGKARWACIDTPTLQIVKSVTHELKLKSEEPIFTKSKRAYQYMVERVATRAGIKRVKVTAHTLRHTNITMLLSKDMPIERVKEHAGHEDIGTTMIYTHLTYAPTKRSYLDIMGE